MRWNPIARAFRAILERPDSDSHGDAAVVRELFEAELTKRGISFSPQDDGTYTMTLDSGEATISIENVAREYERSQDPAAVARWVDITLSPFEPPPWPTARSLVYFVAEPSCQTFEDTIRDNVTDSVCKVLGVMNEARNRFCWLSPGFLAEWNVSEEEVRAAASRNMAQLLDGKRVEIMKVGEMKLGAIPVEAVFKASVIFAPNLREFVSSDIGWPVLAVIPCRDFIYVISEKDKALLDRMGVVVQKEFRGSGYPITTEVLRISDEGIEAIGSYPE